MANKTQPTEVDPAAFVEALPKPVQREDGRALLELMSEVSGEVPTMWGPSMVGYGTYHYRGRSTSGEWFRMGFSPRSTQVVLYGGYPESLREVLDRLGPYSTGKGCIYLKRLSDVDPVVLRKLVERIWAEAPTST